MVSYFGGKGVPSVISSQALYDSCFSPYFIKILEVVNDSFSRVSAKDLVVS